MKRIFSFSFLFSLLLTGMLSAQNTPHRVCGSMEVLERQMIENPLLRSTRDAIEQHTRQFQQNGGGVTERAVVTIPVVVHVVWKTAAQNVSTAQIQSQLDVLNADLRRLNVDAVNTPAAFQGIAADCEVNFCLATQKPDGTATTGIEYRQTTVTAFGTNDAMKFYSSGGLDAWDASKYLNLWVCNMSGGILGYAQFPGGPANTDGVVILYSAFGTNGSATAPFNLGRTATHEVGHWLNLYHIWGDDGTACTGTDNCADTPNQADENYACPTFPAVSCSNGPNGDMFMNYMDYTDDACMNLFTAGQKARMQALFASGGSRASLASSPGCQPPSGGSCGTPSNLAATGVTSTAATLNWAAASGATAYNLQWKTNSATTWTTVSNLSGTSYNLTGLTANTTYNFKVQAVCGATAGTYSAATNFTTLPTGGTCTDTYEPNNTRNTAKSIAVNTNITALINPSTDKDYFKFNNTATQKNIKVELTNLPADYDLKLYKGATLVGTSENANTLPEVLIYNTTTAATTYYAYVYPYNGAFNATLCYTLKASISSTAFRTDGSTDGETEEIEIPVIIEYGSFGMYPNPATDQLTLQIPMEADQDVQIAIRDASGKTLLSTTKSLGKAGNTVQLDLSRFSGGFYFVEVRNGEKVAVQKLAIQR